MIQVWPIMFDSCKLGIVLVSVHKFQPKPQTPSQNFHLYIAIISCPSRRHLETLAPGTTGAAAVLPLPGKFPAQAAVLPLQVPWSPGTGTTVAPSGTTAGSQ